MTALGAIFGTLVGLYTGGMAPTTNWVLPFTAGKLERKETEIQRKPINSF